MTNGQQRPANPNRFAVWHAKQFEDGRPPASEFSVSLEISLDLLRQLYDGVATGLVQPVNNYQGVPCIKIWGNGYRGNPGRDGAPGPVLTGTLTTPKAIWQAQQAAQQQVAPAHANAFPAQQQAAPQQAAAPAYVPSSQQPPLPAGFPMPEQQQPAPQAAPAPVQQGWAAQPAQGNQWASTPPAL
jgi:hypothetical protein